MSAPELLRPTIAVVDYDRTRPLLDGRVRVRGCEPVWQWQMPIEDMFAKALGEAAFDVAELSFSNHLTRVSRGDSAYLGLPIFPSRSFRHGAWFVRAAGGVKSPDDLKGKRVGVREYSMTAAVTARGILEDEHGVAASDICWIVGDVDAPERAIIPLPDLARPVRVEAAPEGSCLNEMLLDGRIDALLAYKPPKSFAEGDPRIVRLYDDHVASERAFARRTGIFPIMHLVGIRRDVAAAAPWLPEALLDAFGRARDLAISDLASVQVLKVSLPWPGTAYAEACEILGEDYWPYGISKNVSAVEALAKWHYAQGLSSRLIEASDIFVSES